VASSTVSHSQTSRNGLTGFCFSAREGGREHKASDGASLRAKSVETDSNKTSKPVKRATATPVENLPELRCRPFHGLFSFFLMYHHGFRSRTRFIRGFTLLPAFAGKIRKVEIQYAQKTKTADWGRTVSAVSFTA
jgi:hypothetical protein